MSMLDHTSVLFYLPSFKLRSTNKHHAEKHFAGTKVRRKAQKISVGRKTDYEIDPSPLDHKGSPLKIKSLYFWTAQFFVGICVYLRYTIQENWVSVNCFLHCMLLNKCYYQGLKYVPFKL